MFECTPQKPNNMLNLRMEDSSDNFLGGCNFNLFFICSLLIIWKKHVRKIWLIFFQMGWFQPPTSITLSKIVTENDYRGYTDAPKMTMIGIPRWFFFSSSWSSAFNPPVHLLHSIHRGCADQCGTKILRAVHLGWTGGFFRGRLRQTQRFFWVLFLVPEKCPQNFQGIGKELWYFFGVWGSWRNGMTKVQVSNCTWIPSTFITNGLGWRFAAY